MDLTAKDAQLRQAAFDHVNRLVGLQGGVLNSDDLGRGFEFDGERIPLVNPQRGIFKPRQMAALLSIRTVFPRRGGPVWYDDQREAHQQIYAGDEMVEYAFMGTDPNSPDNRWLREAMEQQVPSSISSGSHRAGISPSSQLSSSDGTRSAYGSSLPSAQSSAHPLTLLPPLRPSGVMHFEKSKRDCIRHRSVTQCWPRMTGVVRSLSCLSRGCSMPPTSSLTPTSS